MTHYAQLDKLQEKESVHRMLLAQRRLYSKAKNLFWGQLALLVLLPIAAAIASKSPTCIPGLTTCVAILVLLSDVLWIDPKIKNVRSIALNIQEQIDCELFGLTWPSWKLREKEPYNKYCPENRKELGAAIAKEKLAHWYIDPKAGRSFQVLVLGCQLQNVFYSKELRAHLRGFLGAALAILAFGGLVWGYLANVPTQEIVTRWYVVAIPAMNWLARELVRLRDSLKRLQLVNQSIRDAVNGHPFAFTSRNVQDEIIELRRSLPVVADVHYWWLRDKIEAMLKRGVL